MATAVDNSKSSNGPVWIKPFLRALRQQPNVSRAARIACVSRETPYKRCRTHPEFDAQFREAMDLGFEAMNDALVDAVFEGDVSTAKWLLSRYDPARWGDRQQVDQRITGAIQHAVVLIPGAVDAAADELEYRRAADDALPATPEPLPALPVGADDE